MKPKLETSYRNSTESSEASEVVVDTDTALEPDADLNELAELYRVDSSVSTEEAVSADTSQVAMFEKDIATLETDLANITADTNLDASLSIPATEADIFSEKSNDSLLNQNMVEVQPTMTAGELRNRYDGAYRRTATREAWEKRGRQYQARAEKREKFSIEAETAEVEQAKANVNSYESSYRERLDQELINLRRETKGSLDHFNTMIGYEQEYIARRNPLQKIIAFGQKYVSFLGSDYEKSKIGKFEAKKQELLAEEAQKNAGIQSRIEQLKLEIQGKQESTDKYIQRIQAWYAYNRAENESTFVSDRKNLLESVREKNQHSRLASEKTAELLAEGKLNVAELAKETNSLVVHTLPLDGWSMNNTSMNNTEVNVTELTAGEKIAIVTEKQPDLAVSIVAIDNPDVKHGTMYPFGLIVDGSIIASYDDDSSTIAKGDKRYRKYTWGHNGKGNTLQADPVGAFINNTVNKPRGPDGYNEAIVHKPRVRGIFIDGERLKPVTDTETGEPHDYYKDKVEVYYLPGQEAQMLKQYKDVMDEGDDVIIEEKMDRTKVIAKSGPYAGQEVFGFRRVRSGEQKAIEFAQSNYPDLPIYIRRADGVYDINGQPVSAEDIYAT